VVERTQNLSAVTDAKPTKRPRKARTRPRLGPLLPIVVLAVVGFLYYQPLSSLVSTRGQLAERRDDVESLRRQKVEVLARLARSTSLDVLARDARRIGYVRPGEQLFIVKGISDWRRARRSAGDR
jgi:cell division protein FtsB